MSSSTASVGGDINPLTHQDEDEIRIFASSSEDLNEDDEHSSHQNQNFCVLGESSSSTNESYSNSTSDYLSEVLHDVKPEVPEEFKPNYLMRFKSVEDGVKMYKSYAEKAGFDVRLNTLRKDGDIIKHRYLLCSRNGKPPEKSVNMMNQRKTRYKVTNCKAKIVVKRVKETNEYKFDQFVEMHNHELEDIHDLRKTRQLSFSDKEFIVRASTAKIGASKAYKFKSTLKGGFQNVKGKVTDYKNFKRDMGSIIGFKDAQRIVNKMNERKDNYPNYSFYYKCDENKVLNALFWVDETEKAYYSEFGDVMSLDATFRTNKYGLVFVPFTVIDHHKSSVTVGAGLLSTEDVGSYKWLLEHFLMAHGNKHPLLVLTDQDAALKQAVESVFSNSRHRFCMWHIIKKLQKKVGSDFLRNSNFKKRFKKIVWDMNIEPDVFESNWDLLMKEFMFEEKRWFKDIFEIRESWIPAYFKDFPRCGLMKTTSRSESINSFFNSYSQSENFLLNFMMNYDNAVQKLRYTQRELDHKTKGAHYVFKSPRKIEEHAAKVYTSKIFFEVQKEMYKGSWYCETTDFNEGDGWEVYTVIHNNRRNEFKAKYKVELKVAEKEIRCSCDHFNRFGILCRHAFRILMRKDFKEIPEQYILRRWRKDVISLNYHLTRDRFDERDADVTKLVNEAFFNFESCIDIVRDDKEKLASFVEKTQCMLNDMKSNSSSEVSNKKSDEVEKLLGVSIPQEIEIQVPNIQHNKGSGKKRLIGEAERSIIQSQKKTRVCTGCGKREPHNYRTCPVRIASEKNK